MRRIIIIGTALAVLVSAAAAWAASDPNSYKSSVATSPKKAGSAAKPKPLGWTQTISVKSNQSGKNAAPLKDIKTWIYGFKVDTKLAPTCSSSTIESSDGSSCPAKSVVATGTLSAVLGPPNRDSAESENCDVDLSVYNGGKNYVWFFFKVPSPSDCPGVTTGDVTPYKGTFSKSGKDLVLNVPVPADASTDAGNLGFYGSLVHESLTWKKITKKHKGYFTTDACKAGKRPYKVKYTDTTNGSNSYSTTQSGKAKC